MRQETIEVWRVIGRARGGRRDVDAVDVEWRRVVEDGDGDDFEKGIDVGDGGRVQRLKFDIMVDEDGDAAAPAAIRTISPAESEVGEGWIFVVGAKFGFLETGYLDIVIA